MKCLIFIAVDRKLTSRSKRNFPLRQQYSNAPYRIPQYGSLHKLDINNILGHSNAPIDQNAHLDIPRMPNKGEIHPATYFFCVDIVIRFGMQCTSLKNNMLLFFHTVCFFFPANEFHTLFSFSISIECEYVKLVSQNWV